MSVRFRIVETKAGPVGIVASGRGLRRVFLPRRGARELRRRIRAAFPRAREDGRLLGGLARDLRRYFAGRPVRFAVRLDWSGCSRFEAEVWRACRLIPAGQSCSYKSLAEAAGRSGSARAVGRAMSRNRLPLVVPCHRVLRSDGSLGGYSGPGGVAFKRRLLALERAALEAGMAVAAPRPRRPRRPGGGAGGGRPVEARARRGL